MLLKSKGLIIRNVTEDETLRAEMVEKAKAPHRSPNLYWRYPHWWI